MASQNKAAALLGRVCRIVSFVISIIAALFSDHVIAGTSSSGLSLSFSSYFGGSSEDTIRDIATDSQGNIYLTGGTASSNFPTTPGAYDRTFNGWHDVFVAKLDPAGRLLWSTFLGGPNYDRAYAIELDNQGYIYITGRSGPGFPVTAGALQTTYQGFYSGSLYGNQNAFICKLKPDGSSLVFCSYFGPFELNRDLAIDQNAEIYVVSNYDPAKNGALPQSWFANAFQKAPRGSMDGVVAKIKTDGSQVLWATLLGGSGFDSAAPSIRVNAHGTPYALLYTVSSDIPTTPGAYDRTYNGGGDLYLAKLAPDGSHLIYATYLGGSQAEFSETHGVALDAQENSYIAATTTSADFPTTTTAFQPAYGGSGGSGSGEGTNYPGDVFVSKISADGSQLLSSTFVGGRFGEGGEGVSVDTLGNVSIAGATYSDNFPTTTDAFQSNNKGGGDCFAVRLSADFSRLLYASLLGGSGTDYCRTATIDSQGNFHVAGMTQSDNWPLLTPLQASRSGSWDGAVAKLTFWSDIVRPTAPTGLRLQ